MSKDDDGQLDGVVYKGVLEKVARLGFNSKRLCVLSEKQFSYFSDQKAQGTLKAIFLKDVQAVKRDHSSKNFQFEIITEQRTELFAAASLEQLEHWVRILQFAILSTRRTSQSSYPGLRKSASHKYEDVDIDEHKQPRVSASLDMTPKSTAVTINGYEEVDIDVGSTPKLVTGLQGCKEKPEPAVYSLAKSIEGSKPIKETRPPSVSINNYETIDIDDDSSPKLVTKATEGATQHPPQLTTESIPSRPPVYDLAKHITESKNTENDISINQDPLNKPKLPARRGVCSTVDSLGGPLPARPLEKKPFQAPDIPNSDLTAPIYSEAVSEKRPNVDLQVKETKLVKGEVTNSTNIAGNTGVTRHDSDLYAKVNKIKTYRKDRENESALYSSVDDVIPAETIQHSEVTRQSKEMEVYADGASTKVEQYENLLDDEIYDEAQSSNLSNNPPLSESSKTNSMKEAEINQDRKVRNGKLPISGSMPNKKKDDSTTEDTTTVYNTVTLDQIFDKTDVKDAKGKEESKPSDISTVLAHPISPPTPSLKYGALKKHQAIQELEKYLSSQQINTYQFSFLTRESSQEAIRKLKTYLEQI